MPWELRPTGTTDTTSPSASPTSTSPSGSPSSVVSGLPPTGLMSYPNTAYQNIPSLQYLQYKMDSPTYNTQATGTKTGAFDTSIPEAGAIGADRAYDLQQDPDAMAVLDSLYRAGNRNLASTLARVYSRFGQVGRGVKTSQVMT